MKQNKYILTILSIFVFSCGSNQKIKQKSLTSRTNQFKIGFGSCLDQKKPMPILNSIKSENFDLFFMLGDNIYGSSKDGDCLLYTSPSPRDATLSRMPSSA